MPPHQIVSDEQRLSKLSKNLNEAIADVDLPLQYVFSNHLVLAGAGHVENSVLAILAEYCRQHSNIPIKRYVAKTVSRNNSLNCEKIKSISDDFDTSWWPEIINSTGQNVRDSIDSLKTLRDQIAHGKMNGTGITVVSQYCSDARIFVRKYSEIVLGP